MTQLPNTDGGFVILSGRKTWYSSSTTSTPPAKTKTKTSRSANKSRASAKSQPQIVYPIFQTCVEFTEDPYWKSMMHEAAIGNFPRSFRYQNGALTYRVKSKIIERQIPTNNPVETLTAVQKFMMEAAGITSPIDIENKKVEIEKRLVDYMMHEATNWSEIRSNGYKSILISLFVEKLGAEYNLQLDQREALENIIKIGVMAGYFGNDNIHIVGNVITSIDGLLRDPQTGAFSIDIVNYKPHTKKTATRKAGGKRTIRMEMDSTNDETLSLERDDGSSSLGNENPIYSLSFGNKEVCITQLWERFLSDMSKKTYTHGSVDSTPLPGPLGYNGSSEMQTSPPLPAQPSFLPGHLSHLSLISG
jgi:hypothetical protein